MRRRMDIVRRQLGPRPASQRRVEAGAILYTSAPLGLFLATEVTWLISGVALK